MQHRRRETDSAAFGQEITIAGSTVLQHYLGLLAEMKRTAIERG